jgi:molybdopterin converting factor small subunit
MFATTAFCSVSNTNDMSKTERKRSTQAETTVDVHCTGHVREAVGIPRQDFSFEGSTLRAFLDAFCQQYDVAELLIAETDADASTDGWAPEPAAGELPGTWKRNPEGEQTRQYARVAVNGVFNEHLDGLDTELDDGDRVGLMYPFIFCC